MTAVLLLASALTGGAALRASAAVFLGWGSRAHEGGDTPHREQKETDEKYDDPPAVMLIPIAMLIALALTAGLWPGFAPRTEQAAQRFIDRPAYVDVVLHGQSATPVPAPAESGWTGAGIASGIGAAAAAVVAAAVALFRRRIPRGIRRVAGAAGRPLVGLLPALHSGNISDYVAWLVAGVAALGGLLTLVAW